MTTSIAYANFGFFEPTLSVYKGKAIDIPEPKQPVLFPPKCEIKGYRVEPSENNTVLKFRPYIRVRDLNGKDHMIYGNLFDTIESAQAERNTMVKMRDNLKIFYNIPIRRK